MAEANYDESLIKMKENFLMNLFSESSNSNVNSALLTKRKYDSIIENVKRLKVTKKKEAKEYRIIQRYDVLETVDGCEKLIESFSDGKESVRQFVHVDELFDILYSNHMSLGHAGRDKMGKQLNLFYRNITKAQISTFLDLCEQCREKRLKKENATNIKKNVVPDDSFETILGCSSTDIDNNHQTHVQGTENIASGSNENAWEANSSGNYTETICTPAQHVPTAQPNFTTPNMFQNSLYPNLPQHPPRNSKVTQNPSNMPQNQSNMKVLQNPSNMPQNRRNFHWKPNLSTTNSPQNPSKTKMPKNPSNANMSQDPSNKNMTSNYLPREKDQFDCFGEYIAMKLRQLDLHSASHVQKAVSDIIFDAEMGKYKST